MYDIIDSDTESDNDTDSTFDMSDNMILFYK